MAANTAVRPLVKRLVPQIAPGDRSSPEDQADPLSLHDDQPDLKALRVQTGDGCHRQSCGRRTPCRVVQAAGAPWKRWSSEIRHSIAPSLRAGPLTAARPVRMGGHHPVVHFLGDAIDVRPGAPDGVTGPVRAHLTPPIGDCGSCASCSKWRTSGPNANRLVDTGRICYVQAAHQHVVASGQVSAAETSRIVVTTFQPLSTNSFAVA
jgi:hypothetical protein